MAAPDTTWQVAGHRIEIDDPDKVLWPADGLTRGDLLDYYRAIAPVMLPHLDGRPITLRVYPADIESTGYYRRARPNGAPAWLSSVDYRPERGYHTLKAILIDDAADLIWLANAGSIEFHTWPTRAPDLVEPDLAIFDLDPGETATFADVRRAALRLREELDGLGLRGYPKTSGGRGLHISIPLTPGHAFAGVREWVKAFGERLAAAEPALFAVPKGTTHSGGQVTVDYAQNARGRNTAAPYTVRGRPGAPVSTPLAWDELATEGLQPVDFTMRTVPARVDRLEDLYAPLLTDRQRLPAGAPAKMTRPRT